MPTAQDIYDMLIHNPDYQKTNELTREKVVEREANRRARQHANNEKALSMAVQNSAMGKLASFVQNAFVEDVPIQKVFTPFDQKIVQNLPDIKEWLAKIEQGLVGFKGTENNPGWEVSEKDLPNQQERDVDDEKMRVQRANDEDGKPVYEDVSIHAVGRNYSRIVDALRPMVEKFERGGNFGLADVFPNDESLGMILNAIFDGDGTIKAGFKTLWDDWEAHPQVIKYNDAFEALEGGGTETGGPEGTGSGGQNIDDEDTERGADLSSVEKLQNISAGTNTANKKILNSIHEKFFPGAISDIPEIQATQILALMETSRKIKGANRFELRAKLLQDWKPQDVSEEEGTPITPPEEVDTPTDEEVEREVAEAVAELTTKERTYFGDWSGAKPGALFANMDAAEVKARLAYFKAAVEKFPLNNPVSGQPWHSRSKEGQKITADRKKFLEISDKLVSMNQRIANLPTEKHEEFLADLKATTSSSLEDIQGGDPTKAWNLLGHVLDMQGKTPADKQDLVYAWQAGEDYQEEDEEDEEDDSGYDADAQYDKLLALQPKDVQEKHEEFRTREGRLEDKKPLERIARARNFFGLPRRTATGDVLTPSEEKYETADYDENDVDSAEYFNLPTPELKAAYQKWVHTSDEEGTSPAERYYGDDPDPEPMQSLRMIKAYRESMGNPVSTTYNYDDSRGLSGPSTGDSGPISNAGGGEPYVPQIPGTEALSLEQLNRLQLETQKTMRDAPKWIMQNPLTWKFAEGEDPQPEAISNTPWGDLGKGWDTTFFSRDMLGELKEKGLVEFNENAPARGDGRLELTWEWTPKGSAELKPIVDALDKIWFQETNSVQQGRGIVRSPVVREILSALQPEGRGIAPITKTAIENELLRNEAAYRELNLNNMSGRGSPRQTSSPRSEEVTIPGPPDDARGHKNWWWWGVPREIDGFYDREADPPAYHYAKILYPEDEEGKAFNPLEEFDKDGKVITPEKATAILEQLKAKYREIDESLSSFEHTVTNPRKPANRIYNKDSFSPEDTARFNKLYTNKAILEPWLNKFQEYINPTLTGSSQYDSGDSANVRWGKLWIGKEGEASRPWPSDPGAWAWHELLSSTAAQGLQGNPLDDPTESSGVAGRRSLIPAGSKTLDHDGNLNFGIIPPTYLASVEARSNHLSDFLSHFGLPNTAKFAQNELSERYGDSWVTNNFDQAYEDFANQTVGPVEDNKRSKALSEQKEKLEDFYKWLAEDSGDGTTRQSTYVAETPIDRSITGGTRQEGDPRQEGGGPLPDTGSEEEAPGIGQYVWEDNPSELTGQYVWEPGLSDLGEPTDDEEKLQSGWSDSPPESIAVRNKRIKAILDQEFGTGKWDFGDAAGTGAADEIELLTLLTPEKLMTAWENRVVKIAAKKRAASQAEAEKDEAKQTAIANQIPTGKTPEEKEETRNAIRDKYIEVHGEEIEPRVLQSWSDKDMDTNYNKLVEELRKKGAAEHAERMKNTGNAIATTITSLVPHQEHLTEEDIIMQNRRLIHFQAAYSTYMSTAALAVWRERLQEVYKFADVHHIDLQEKITQDMQDSPTDYSSDKWIERVGAGTEEAQRRRNDHRNAVSQGAELRNNVNYKPHLVAKYDDNMKFRTFHNLGTQRDMAHRELAFDEDSHYHFHGLDPELAKDYRYINHLREQQKAGGELDAEQLKDLDDLGPEVDQAEKYQKVRDRFAQIGSLPTAQHRFFNQFGSDENNNIGRPLLPGQDGGQEVVPRFHQGPSDEEGTLGWYHPESQSWINPHRYQELMDDIRGKPQAGRFLPSGRGWYGLDKKRSLDRLLRRNRVNPADPRYAFAIPTAAKTATLGAKDSKIDDQSYYIDNTGAITHIQDNFALRNAASHDMPQTTNDVVHDWTAQNLETDMRKEPQKYFNEDKTLKPIADINGDMTSMQKMWLEKVYGEGLGREKGQALYRRGNRGKPGGWEGLSQLPRKLLRPPNPEFHFRDPEGIGERRGWGRFTLNPIKRDPLSRQELGQYMDWSGVAEAKQRLLDVIDWPKFPSVSAAGRFLLQLPYFTRVTRRDDAITAKRKEYAFQARVQQQNRMDASQERGQHYGTRQSAGYVAPGEQEARDEDYKALTRHISNQVQYHVNQAKVAQTAGDKLGQTASQQQANDWTQHHNNLGQLDPGNSWEWPKINEMYETHLDPAKKDEKSIGEILTQPQGQQNNNIPF